MAAWPTVAEVKTVLGLSSDARDSVVTSALGAAIEHVAHDLGYVEVEVSEYQGGFILEAALPPEDDEDADVVEVTPSYSISQAALILVTGVIKAPDAPYGVAAVFDTGGLRVAAEHPTYQQMLLGERQAFGVG